MQSSLKVWWNFRNSRPSRPKLIHCPNFYLSSLVLWSWARPAGTRVRGSIPEGERKAHTHICNERRVHNNHDLFLLSSYLSVFLVPFLSSLMLYIVTLFTNFIVAINVLFYCCPYFTNTTIVIFDVTTTSFLLSCFFAFS